MSEEIRVGLVGLGVIGAGVVRLLKQNNEHIAKKIGRPVKIVKACDIDQRRARGLGLGRGVFTTDYNDIIGDDSIDIMVELIGGVTPAGAMIEAALAAGKHVVTANKELVAKRGRELFTLARRHSRGLKYEAAVGGGIPILHAIDKCLAGNRINRIIAIINGTTNYILTAMTENHADYDEVLGQAIKHGYAEADPTADVEGYDAAYKAVLLAGVAFNKLVPVEKVYREGITGISAEDIQAAEELGYAIKLLAVAEETESGMDVRVHPAFVPREHPLCAVNGVYNGVFIQGTPIGNLMLEGRGAGAEATSSAVVSDIIELGTAPPGADLRPPVLEPAAVAPIGSRQREFYVRMIVRDSPGVLAQIAGVFGKNQVSIASVVQKTPPGGDAEISWIIHRVRERQLAQSLASIEKLPCVIQVQSIIRVEDSSS